MIKRHLAGLIVAAVVAGSGVAAVAAAPGDDTGAAPARPPKEQVKACREAHKAGQEPSEECKQLRQNARRRKAGPGDVLLGHAVHGDLIVKNKEGKFENVTFDKGTVQAKGDKTITLKREDGKTVTIKVNDDTKYRGVEGFDGVQTDRPAIIVSVDGTARSVAQRAPGGNNRPRGNVGSNEEQVPAT